MKLAVITPYHSEPLDVLLRCHRSVADQQYACAHFMIADGFPRPEIDDLAVRHLTLPCSHGDNGNTPRAVGGICAIAEGYDALAYLDADNWYDDHHVATVVGVAEQTGADVVFATRRLRLADGTPCSFEDRDIVERQTADTSSFVLTRRALALAAHWGLMPAALSPICDRVMFTMIRALGLTVAWTPTPSVTYESRWPTHYVAAGLPPPQDAHDTDWDLVEAGYDACTLIERFGFDPFAGVGPRRATHKPTGLVDLV